MNEENINNSNPNPQEPTPGQTPEQAPRSEQQAAPQPGQWQAPPPPPPPPGYYQGPPQYMPYPPPQQPRTARWLIPVSLAIGCLPWLIVIFVVAAVVGLVGAGSSGSHVALLHITGEITGGRSAAGPFSSAVVGSEDVVKQLEKIREDDSAKVVVIRINSPGGSASGSEEIYNEIMRLRKSGKTVYASMGDVAASGGYYIASACNKIYADSNTLTGSIGVIFSLGDMSDLFKKVGYKPEVVKAGKYKDIGSSNRPLTAEERQILQSLVNETYNNFLSSVSKGRNIPMDRLKQLAEGRIYTGMGAKKVNLVDELGGLQETVTAAARSVGISGKPKVVEYGRKTLFGGLFDEDSESTSENLTGAMRREFLKKLLEGEGELRSIK